MTVLVEFAHKLWSFLSFVLFFLLLFIIGLLKGFMVPLILLSAPCFTPLSICVCHCFSTHQQFLGITIIIGPIAVAIILLGNSSVIIGLWTAHFLWTYYCVAKSKKLGLVLKILVLVSLPVPLILWPVFGIIGSLLGGVGYGFFTPLAATLTATGMNIIDKLYHCLIDGCWSTIKSSCIVVVDFTDFCFHSYFSYMDELIKTVPSDEKPMDIKLSRLPSCLLACVIGIPVDVLLITVVALWKSPFMLFKGWKRFLEDLVDREGPFSERLCVPFAGLVIILWPIAVVGAVIASLLSSFVLGLYSGVVVHQEGSLWLGFAYMISVVSLFEEYVNDLLHLGEGSYLPRPRYRRNIKPSHVKKKPDERGKSDSLNGRDGSRNSKLVSENSRTMKLGIQQYKAVQVWDWLFQSCKVNGSILLHDGLVDLKDIEECILKGNCEKLGIKLPAWCILHCLLTSAKSKSSGLVIFDDVELTRTNGPKDKFFEWFIGPLFIIKEQIRTLQLSEKEEICLRKLVMRSKNEKPEDWDDTCFSSSDYVRRAQLQAIIRRLHGIVASMSRIPTFRRRFRNLVKLLYLEAVQTTASDNRIGGILESKNDSKISLQIEEGEERDKNNDKAEINTNENRGMV